MSFIQKKDWRVSARYNWGNQQTMNLGEIAAIGLWLGYFGFRKFLRLLHLTYVLRGSISQTPPYLLLESRPSFGLELYMCACLISLECIVTGCSSVRGYWMVPPMPAKVVGRSLYVDSSPRLPLGLRLLFTLLYWIG